LPDFDPREGLTGAHLAALLDWSEAEFLQRTEGSPIRRIGHARWLRNVAVALGNALASTALSDASTQMIAALHRRSTHESLLVQEHVQWALAQFNNPL
jgi:epoxyqueuosine reductase